MNSINTSDANSKPGQCQVSQGIIEGDLRPCCVDTIDTHSAHNSMLVCPACQQLIKLYSKEVAFNNYVAFCRSKRRKGVTAQYGDFFVVVLVSYT